MYVDIGRSLSTDYFLIADQLTREELSYLQRTRDFVDNEVLPPGGRFTMALLKPAASGWRLPGRDPRAARACFLLLRGGYCPPDSRLFGRPGRSLPDATSVIAPTSG